MKTILKKSLSWVLVLSFLFVLIGCSSKDSAQVQQDFHVFLEELPAQFISENDMSLEFLFENPQDYGFKDVLLELPYSTLDDYKEMNTESQKLLEELDKFSYEDLTSEQQLTYDILKDYLKRIQIDEKFYYLDNSYLGSFIGFQAQLPLLLSEYTFERESDLKSYFHILEQSSEVFHQYVEVEIKRQEQGVGMSQDILNAVIQQCENFGKDKDTFLIEEINKKIDDVDFYDDAQKAEAKKKNESLLRNNLLKAYEDTAKELSQIKAAEKTVGLASLPNGKEYYEYLVKRNIGTDESISHIQAYLEKKLANATLRLTNMEKENPQIVDDYINKGLHYGNMQSFEECIDYLTDKVRNDYPHVDKIPYDVTVVPNSMKENFSPAAYLKGKLDASKDSSEHIYVNNPSYNNELFDTIVHEAYPGHMYQNYYFRQLELPTVRYLIDYNGYSEGWATYVENKSYEYADANAEQKVLLELNSINKVMTECLIGLMDIGIHYEGWTYEDYYQKMSQFYGSDNDVLKKQYNYIVETPSNYLQYYVNGMKFQDLYDRASSKLGDQFRPSEFHKVLLNTGPAPFSVIEKQVENYIEKNS